jgi:hypothetical protein
MLSAMFNLTGMVEDLLLNTGRDRKRPVARAGDGLMPASVTLRSEGRSQISGTVVAEPVAVREAGAPVIPSPTQNHSTGKFGSLGRRRKRGALAVLSVLLLGLLLLLFVPKINEDETAASTGPDPDSAESREPPEERPAGTGAEDADEQGDAPPNNKAAAGATPQPETTAVEGSTDDSVVTADTNGAASNGGGIPDVSGRPLKEAARILSRAGYGVAATKSVKDREEYGTVIGTEPSAGTEVGPNAPVVLTMSAGPTGVASAGASSAGSSAASASASSSVSGASSASASSASASPASVTPASASASASPSP